MAWWGPDYHGRGVRDHQGLAAGVTAISMGNGHACAVVNGGVRCWGDNSLGELGDDSQRSSLIRVAVTLL
jgi:hypothetical protein